MPSNSIKPRTSGVEYSLCEIKLIIKNYIRPYNRPILLLKKFIQAVYTTLVFSNIFANILINSAGL